MSAVGGGRVVPKSRQSNQGCVNFTVNQGAGVKFCGRPTCKVTIVKFLADNVNLKPALNSVPGDQIPAPLPRLPLADEDVPLVLAGVRVAVLVQRAPALVPDEGEGLVELERVAQLHRVSTIWK